MDRSENYSFYYTIIFIVIEHIIMGEDKKWKHADVLRMYHELNFIT